MKLTINNKIQIAIVSNLILLLIVIRNLLNDKIFVKNNNIQKEQSGIEQMI